MDAIGGDASAADRAAKVSAFLHTKPVPPGESRAARWLALEARGFALRHATDDLLIRSAMITELTGVAGSRKELAASLLNALDQWKKDCDDLIDEAITANDDNLTATLLHMRSHHQLQEVSHTFGWRRGTRHSRRRCQRSSPKASRAPRVPAMRSGKGHRSDACTRGWAGNGLAVGRRQEIRRVTHREADHCRPVYRSSSSPACASSSGR